MRRFGLQGLLLRERSAAAMLDCLNHLRSNGPALQLAFAEAQRHSGRQPEARHLTAFLTS